jgi:outer membrane protein assembly factor BamB
MLDNAKAGWMTCTDGLVYVVAGVVYTGAASSVSAASGAVVALNAATGKRIWRSADVGGFPVTLAVTGGVVCGSVLAERVVRSRCPDRSPAIADDIPRRGTGRHG